MLRAPPPPPPLPSGLGPTTQEPWDRGHGVVQVEFTKEGAETLGLQAVRNYFPNQVPQYIFLIRSLTLRCQGDTSRKISLWVIF